MRLYNQVYRKIGIDYGIVNSIDGYDEISLTSDFKVTTNNYERIFKPQDLGFEIAKPEEVRGGATEREAKDIFDAVLENRALPAQKNIVLANAAFGIQVMEKGRRASMNAWRLHAKALILERLLLHSRNSWNSIVKEDGYFRRNRCSQENRNRTA